MKKNIFFAGVLVCLFMSCTQDDSVSNEKLQQKDGSPQQNETNVNSNLEIVESKTTAKTAWSYMTQPWSTSYLLAGSTGKIICYNDFGTNNTSKRAVFTVSNDGASDGEITVSVQRTDACVSNPSNEVLILTVPKGGQKTGFVSITGYSNTQLRVQIKSSNGSFGNYSGLITYGYEY